MFRRRYLYVTIVLSLLFSMLGGSAVFAEDQAPEDLPGAGWYSGVQLQNVGAAEAQFTTTCYSTTSGAANFTMSSTIPVNGSTTKLPHQLNITGSGFQGSCTVSSNQVLNAIANVTNRQTTVEGNAYGVAGGLAAAQYQGVNAPATTVSFPLVKNNFFSKFTTFFVQNAGNAAATINYSFVKSSGGAPITGATASVEAGRMVVLNPQALGFPSGNTDGIGSLTVTSAQPLAGVVLEHGAENPGKQLQATRGFTANDQDTTAYAPIIKNEFANRFTGLQIQNAGTAAVDITVTYAGSNGCVGQTFTSTKTGLAAGASHTFVHLVSQGSPMPAGCLAAAKIVATGPIVAIVNESFIASFLSGGGNGGRQEATTYSAFADKNATTKISVPLYKENAFNKGTGLQVQNVGAANATNVVVTFTSAAGTFTTKPQTIAAGAAFTFVEMFKKPDLFNGAPIPATISGANGIFGVIVTSDQKVVAIANESTYPFPAGSSPLQQDKNNYEGFNQ